MIDEANYNFIKHLLTSGDVQAAKNASHNDLELKRVHTAKDYNQYRRFSTTGLLEGEEYDILPRHKAPNADPLDTFITNDTDTAAVLMARDVKLLDYRIIDGQIFFVFKGKEMCERYEREKLVEGVMVNSNKFISAKMSLKNIIFGIRDKDKR